MFKTINMKLNVVFQALRFTKYFSALQTFHLHMDLILKLAHKQYFLGAQITIKSEQPSRVCLHLF